MQKDNEKRASGGAPQESPDPLKGTIAASLGMTDVTNVPPEFLVPSGAPTKAELTLRMAWMYLDTAIETIEAIDRDDLTDEEATVVYESLLLAKADVRRVVAALRASAPPPEGALDIVALIRSERDSHVGDPVFNTGYQLGIDRAALVVEQTLRHMWASAPREPTDEAIAAYLRAYDADLHAAGSRGVLGAAAGDYANVRRWIAAAYAVDRPRGDGAPPNLTNTITGGDIARYVEAARVGRPAPEGPGQP